MKIGDEIEVSSDEEGFKGSWFKAILEDTLPQSRKKKLNVSLLANDGSSTTRIATYRRFIRPIPPENLFTAAAEFEKGCVVEASRGGGWWTGVVVKKRNDEEAVWVYFDSPPDLFQFQTGQLRQHLYWVKRGWVKPRVKVSLSNKKSRFRCGTMVEVKVDDDNVDVWVPSVIVKELGDKKSFVVKPFKSLSWDDGGGTGGEAPKPNRTVGLSSIRLAPPPANVSVGRSYGLMESVEVFIDPGWRPGRVKSILCDERYTVFMKGTNQSLVLKHNAIRPSHDSVLRITGEVNAANTPQTSLSSGENGETEVPEEHSREEEDDNRKRKRGGAEHTAVLSETTATESGSSLTSSPTRTARALNQTDAGTEDITVQPESSEGCNIRKRTREQNLISSTPTVVQAKDTTLVLPFVKKSPFWKILETSEGFQRAPQTPHFSPLVKESKEQFREGLAFGMMLTHSSLLESFKDLEPHVPMSELKSLKASFAELEKHGFSVSAPLARINKLLALKDRQGKKMEERNGLDREIMALKEGVGEMEHKILELERQQVALKEQRDVAYRKIGEMESSARDNGIELDNLESEFKATASDLWGET